MLNFQLTIETFHSPQRRGERFIRGQVSDVRNSTRRDQKTAGQRPDISKKSLETKTRGQRMLLLRFKFLPY